jgi:hypothetical protein
MSIGKGSGTGFDTMRSRNWPTIRQFSVFVENRVGQLFDLMRVFEGSKVRVAAFSIVDSVDSAIVRLVVTHPEQGLELLRQKGYALAESDLVGVELPRTSQPILQVCTALLQAEINIHYAYPLLLHPHGRPAVALHVDSIEMAMNTLAEKGFTVLSEADLRSEEA